MNWTFTNELDIYYFRDIYYFTRQLTQTQSTASAIRRRARGRGGKVVKTCESGLLTWRRQRGGESIRLRRREREGRCGAGGRRACVRACVRGGRVG